MNVPVSQEINSSRTFDTTESLQNVSLLRDCEKDNKSHEQTETLTSTIVCQTDASIHTVLPPGGELLLENAHSDVYTFHYVPILKTLKTYLEQPDIWASYNQAQVNDGIM